MPLLERSGEISERNFAGSSGVVNAPGLHEQLRCQLGRDTPGLDLQTDESHKPDIYVPEFSEGIPHG